MTETGVRRRADRWWLAGSVPVFVAVGFLAVTFSSPQVAVSYFLMGGAAALGAFLTPREARAPSVASTGRSLLIQQRMAIERQRYPARLGVIFPIFVVVSGLLSTSARGSLDWFVGGMYALLLVVGWVVGGRLYVRYRRELNAFEAEHGEDAGRQDPVPRR